MGGRKKITMTQNIKTRLKRLVECRFCGDEIANGEECWSAPAYNYRRKYECMKCNDKDVLVIPLRAGNVVYNEKRSGWTSGWREDG